MARSRLVFLPVRLLFVPVRLFLSPRAMLDSIGRELLTPIGVERFQKEERNAPMQKQVRRRHDAHVRANVVCTEHSAVFDAIAGGQQTRDAFRTHVADVDRLLALQERSIEDRRAATEQGRLSRQALREAATLVINVGKLVHLDAIVMDTMQLPVPASDETRWGIQIDFSSYSVGVAIGV